MNKTTRAVIALILLLAFIGWLFMTVIPLGSKRPSPGGDGAGETGTTYEPKFRDEGDLVLVSGEGDRVKTIDIELANTPEKIQYGMMYRKSMEEDEGMLFFMGEERPQSFWMKNTYVSLDILFINSAGEVVSIQKNAEPLSEKSLPSEGNASMVLEVKGGFSDRYGLKKGDRIYYHEQ
ncbi:MAG TPA: DUF192 domain-containing protein [Cryomorphaceae bacterium]|nr:DUF192 domain-containing protein [Cryomorphaceae bacterium]